ncbi:MAG: hypothetical protein N3A66_09395 [Planctomycetota bacterium]|nr:hypothetical protein [Planctomycetota bacterium]
MMGQKRLNLAELQPGMVVAQTILDNSGRTILQEGGRLTPMIIGRLEKWGVTTVVIKTDDSGVMAKPQAAGTGVAAAAASEADREFMRKVAEQAIERFRNVENDPLMLELRKLAVAHLVRSGRGAVPGL